MSDQRSKDRDKRVGAYITPALKQKLVERAKARGLSASDLLRLTIEENVGGAVNAKGKK
jgi:hypothetical protein